MVAAQRLSQIQDEEGGEDDQRYQFLNRLELSGGIDLVAVMVCRHGKTIFEERNPPAGQNKCPHWCRGKARLAVLGECHEDVGHAQQKNGKDHQPAPVFLSVRTI